MKTIAALAAAVLLGLATPGCADFAPRGFFAFASSQPQVVAKVSLSEQRMRLVVVTGSGMPQTYDWKVSTGRTGFETPTGSFRPTWLDIDHRSNTYDDAPMPYSVFFTGGYAVHATDAVGRLGRPASHGCVRLAPQHAALFFEIVKIYGKWNTKIVITD